MSNTAEGAVQEFEYRAQMQQLLRLIVHSLYTHKEIFLRELISNASDALNKVRFLSLSDPSLAESEHKVTVTMDSDANTLTVEDTGIGMTREDLVERIGTIASSGTLSFLEEMKQSDQPLDASLIGQFGVGFYASFMVAGRVVIETRHATADSPAFRWTSDGGERYTVEEIERAHYGTTVTLHLKEEEKEFSEEYRIKQIVRKYSNFVDFPIFVGDDQVNTVKALWKKRKEDITDEERGEFYKFVTNNYQDPLGHLHLHIEGLVNFDALLFIPAKAPPGLFREDYDQFIHLYSSGVLIQSNAKHLLPDYLLFVRGVVDTDDLPLNVSREVTQNSPVTAKIRNIITGKILSLLRDWSADEDQERYTNFITEFGRAFKAGIATEHKRRDELIELIRYPSTRTEEGRYTSLKAYVERMPEDQDTIYYLLSDNLDLARQNPNLEYFNSKNLEVLLLAEPVDIFTISHITTYDEKPLKSIESADLELDTEEDDTALPDEDEDTLLSLFRIKLNDKVQDVVASKRLVNSAATLVVASGGMDTQMERMMKMMGQSFGQSPKKVLELNLAHPLMQNILALKRESTSEELIDKAVHQVFEGALLVDGDLKETASFVQRMTELLVEATRSREP